ncbi:hypothetical protein JHD49_00125 [Sulfurimonas sp. SAG-AH-194-C21]|nr:hypothetical protein [Sulfurimonas sp. SAG-AH-194-C21]MDF1882341.1 hypothetical protein [Sulfurimonas sp. SAG-AH-194-C21]
MMKIITALTLALLFVACGAKEENTQNVEAKLVVGKSLSGLTLQDQFEKEHTLKKNTKKVIFAFAKDAAHICNDYFETQEASYLSQYNVEFIADVSAAPSIIKSLFILPGLKDFKHTVLLLNEKSVAAPFRKDMDTEKITVVYLDDGKIKSIMTINAKEELKSTIEATK